MKKKDILITGGLGFIGSNLTKNLVQKKNQITIISRSNKRLENIEEIKNKVKIIYKDIQEIGEEVRNKDYIFHLASTVDNYNIQTDPYLDIDVNCNGTIALLEACKKYNPSVKIIYGSTFFVNGNLNKLPATPESPCNPLGLYPTTKLAAENFCKIYNQTFDMNTTIARFTNVFGVPEEGNNKKKAALNYLLNLAVQDKEIPVYGDGNFIRDYIYVDDVISGLLKIADKGKKGDIYYVGRGEKTKFIDLIKMALEESGTGKIKYVSPPDFHNRVGINDYFCDNGPLKKLGWEPKISIREGIKKTIEYYKNE